MGLLQEDVTQSTHRILRNTTIIYSRIILSQLFYNTNFIAFSPTIHSILRIVALQEESFIQDYKQFVLNCLLENNTDNLQIIMNGFDQECLILFKNEYAESVKGIRSVSFNTDEEICSVPQLRMFIILTDVLSEYGSVNFIIINKK